MTEILSNNDPQQQPSGKFQFPDKKAHLLYWPIVIVGVIADLWSKHAVFAWLDGNGGMDLRHVVVEGWFSLLARENTGAAFSIARGHTAMLIGVSVIALIVVMGLFFFGRIRGKLMNIGLALFTAGIIGNMYDRIFNDGSVRDFISVYYTNADGRYPLSMINPWPTFNVADSMLCVAVGLLVIANIKADLSERRDLQQTEEL